MLYGSTARFLRNYDTLATAFLWALADSSPDCEGACAASGLHEALSYRAAWGPYTFPIMLLSGTL